MAVQYPQIDSIRGLSGASDLWDQPQASVIVLDDYLTQASGVSTVSVTKAVVYAVKVTRSAITKSAKYTIRKQQTAITKALRYTTKAPLSITKALTYSIRKQQSAITKGLIYRVNKSTTITKGLIYSIKKTVSAITKSMQYSHPTSSATISVTKALTYRLLKSTSLSKLLAYKVKRSNINIVLSMRYVLIKNYFITKQLRYYIGRTSVKQASMQYIIANRRSIVKSLTYRSEYPRTPDAILLEDDLSVTALEESDIQVQSLYEDSNNSLYLNERE